MSLLRVRKRNGQEQPVSFDKILTRIKTLSTNLKVNPAQIAQTTIKGLYDLVKTSDLDILAAENSGCNSSHPDYDTLATRISVSNLHKETSDKFSVVMRQEYEYINPKTKQQSPQISEETFQIVEKYKDVLDEAIKHERDYDFNFFGFRTLSARYLCQLDGQIVERPQYLWMRVSIGIHGDDIESVLQTYDLISKKMFTHATPTLYNAGTMRPQMSSCFLGTVGDTIANDINSDGDGIYDTLKKCSLISKFAGGIGLSIHDVRACGSYIKGTNGVSNGIVPMLRVYNDTARYVDQGGGKRKGSIAIYLEPWHADIKDFLILKNNNGKEERRARDLFYGLWVPDLFMERFRDDKMWSLFCPAEAPGLADCYGSEFKKLYESYENEGRFREQIPARELMKMICDSQIETSQPYMLYKDACNEKSNQKNLGTIRSSNLCTEIVEYTAPDEIAVCNLASMCLPAYVSTREDGTKYYDFEALHRNVKIVTKNLNRIIDRNYYPVKETKNSNLRHRPIGIGVQGLADTFYLLKYPYESEEAKLLNKQIFATIYHAALEQSNELSQIEGHYSTFEGSPASKGILQFDMWNQKPLEMYDWAELKQKICKSGLRNSLLVAPMPTASTSQIMGNSECFEPYVSNIYARKVLSGQFTVLNRFLVDDLNRLGLWNEEMRELIIAHKGSIQYIDSIPDELKQIYKTVWEIDNKCLVDMSADRGIYIDQSQSFSIYMENPSITKLSSFHNYAWSVGLKTGMYYARSRPAVDPIQFTVNHNIRKDVENSKLKRKLQNEEGDKKRRKIETDSSGSQFFCTRGGDCESCGS